MCYLTCWVWLLSLSVMFSRFVHAIHPWISTPFLLALNSFLTACIFYCWVTNLCLTLCEPMGYSMPGSSVLHYLLDFAQIESVMLSNHLILSHSFLFLPSIFPSMGVFSNKSALHIRWPKYWSFNFSLNLSNEYSGLTSLGLTGLISLQSKELSRVFFSTTTQKHLIFRAQPSLLLHFHIHTRLLGKP